MVKEGTLRAQATNWSGGFEVTTDASSVVGHAGAALLRELADRVGLTGWVDLGNWPPGTRAICRREDAHPGGVRLR